MHKYVENGLKAAIPVALVGAMVFSIPMFANQKSENISFDKTAEIKGNISFGAFEAPKGFAVVEGRSTENISPLQAAQYPGAWMNPQKTCKFTPAIVSMPENLKDRGDEFLSKKYLFDEAETLQAIPSEVMKISFDSTEGELASVYSSYNVPNNGSLSDNMNSGDYYRTLAARVITTPTTLASDSSAPDANSTKSLPVITFSYDCVNKDAYKENEFKQMVNAMKIDFTKELSSEVPAKNSSESKVPVVDDPSDDVEDGYTVVKKEFENPDVIDRGTGRKADDDSPVVTDPEQVQVTEPAWKQ